MGRDGTWVTRGVFLVYHSETEGFVGLLVYHSETEGLWGFWFNTQKLRVCGVFGLILRN